MKKINPIVFLFSLLALACIVYAPGLQGGFLFDDYVNLDALGETGSVNNWVALKNYILGGWSGPTGRPISLLSFLLNDNTWPSVAYSFKYTNICLHLICGLLLAWFIYLLLITVRFEEKKATYLSILSAGFWLLHPFWVSTTLYVVQRMTILSDLFMLLGFVMYLKGRSRLVQIDHHPSYSAYVLMSLGAGLGTLLAVLSKENGAILPMLILLLELFFYRMQVKHRPNKLWVALFLVLPSLAILGYLIKNINFSPDLWPSRPFNQMERLLSEARIVWDYLGQIWLPKIEGNGLFQDGYQISRSITDPISTLWALLAWLAVVISLPFLYKKLPFVFLAIVFFLCSHLIESTVIGLELIFEHRNYAPASLMFLPLALGVDYLRRQYDAKMAILVAALLLALLSGMTWQRSTLWGDNDKLQNYWAHNAQNSPRARNHLIADYTNTKQYDEALVLAGQSVIDMPDSPLLLISWLRIRVNTKQATAADFDYVAQTFPNQFPDAQALKGLRVLVDDIFATKELNQYRQPLIGLFLHLESLDKYKKIPLFMRAISYNLARLYLVSGDISKSKDNYLIALERYGTAPAAMQMFSELAETGHIQEANEFLLVVEGKINAGSLNVEPLGKQYYIQEINRMKANLAADGLPSS